MALKSREVRIFYANKIVRERVFTNIKNYFCGKMDQTVTYNGYTLHYKIFGNGKEPLIAFHGFNRSADDFKIFESSLGRYYTFYSFNLFYYGNSTIEKGKELSFDFDDLKGLINQFCQKEGIERFSLLGYSMGGRVAMVCLELFCEQVDALYLLAPDGVKMNNWYNLFAKSILVRKLYKHIIKDPSIFFKLANILRRRKMVTESLYNFAMHHMHSAEKRQKVFDVWMSLRKILPNPRHIHKILKDKKIRLHLFFGKYDHIIRVQTGREFVKLLGRQEALHVIDSGHNLVYYALNPYLLEILKDERGGGGSVK